MGCGKNNECLLTDDHSHDNHFCCDCKHYENGDKNGPCSNCLFSHPLGCMFELKETEEKMSSKIDIDINGVKLEAEIDGEASEPSNGIQGGFDIIALYRDGVDIWPVMQDFECFKELILEAIETEVEKRRES